jgi:hypothetical protein
MPESGRCHSVYSVVFMAGGSKLPSYSIIFLANGVLSNRTYFRWVTYIKTNSHAHFLVFCGNKSHFRRLNMELDLQSLFGLYVYSCSYWLRPPQPPPPLPTHLGSYTRMLLVSRDRRHLFVTPWLVPCTVCPCTPGFCVLSLLVLEFNGLAFFVVLYFLSLKNQGNKYVR